MQSKVLGSPLLAVKQSTAHTKHQLEREGVTGGKECRGLPAKEDRNTCQPQTFSIFILMYVGSNLCEVIKMWVTVPFLHIFNVVLNIVPELFCVSAAV